MSNGKPSASKPRLSFLSLSHEVCILSLIFAHTFLPIGAGYDQLSIPSLSDSHILVSNTPTAVDASTSDTALFLLLACIRNFGAAQLALRSGTFKGQPPPALGHDPEGKTVGILGMGGIGRAFKRRVEPLGMNVIYHNRKPLPDDQAEGASYVSFDDLLHKCDILFVSLPLNPATRHILSHTALSQLKPGAIIINTARGPIIDESAMVELIKSGHIRSVGLDVYENEPSVHPELIRMEKEEGKVVLLPHMGTYTQETQEKMELLCVANVVAGVMWPGRYEYEGGEDVIKGTNAGDGKKGERAVGEEFVTGRIVEQKDQMEI